MASMSRVAALALLLLCVDALAAVTTTVVDLPTRPGITVRFLYVRPDNPIANVLVLSGGSGMLGIQADGTMTTYESGCGPIVRNRQAFTDHGYALALADAASDGTVYDPIDVVEMVRFLRAHDTLPTWAAGGSSATDPILYLGARLPLDTPLGLVVFSPGPPTASIAGAVTRPVGIIFNGNDASQRAAALYSALTSATIKQSISVSGGSNNLCGYHLFQGLDAQFIAAMTGFIDAHSAALGSAPPAALAVEFYNASLDHYFLTHIANEIAILDAGVTIRGWARTGQSFNVYSDAGAGTSPVCRFYIPPANGNSHFYGRGTAECSATGAAHPTFVNEDPQFFHVVLPTAGVCPTGARNVYRVFSNRIDANHRYMVDPAIRDTMTRGGWLAEGDGPNLVVMCSPL